MTEDELREAITEPARKAKIEIEDGLVELLLREVSPRGASRIPDAGHDPGTLPLLSYALYATWNQGQGRRLTIDDYRAVGGIAGAVAASADRVYGRLSAPERELGRRIFLSLVRLAADAADTRRRVAIAQLQAEHATAGTAAVDDVIDRFVAQRLLTIDQETVEISHDALLTAWPQLRAWLDGDRAGLIIGQHLTDSSAAWLRDQRDPGELYQGTRLAAAQAWAADNRHDLPV